MFYVSYHYFYRQFYHAVFLDAIKLLHTHYEHPSIQSHCKTKDFETQISIIVKISPFPSNVINPPKKPFEQKQVHTGLVKRNFAIIV